MRGLCCLGLRNLPYVRHSGCASSFVCTVPPCPRTRTRPILLLCALSTADISIGRKKRRCPRWPSTSNPPPFVTPSRSTQNRCDAADGREMLERCTQIFVGSSFCLQYPKHVAHPREQMLKAGTLSDCRSTYRNRKNR